MLPDPDKCLYQSLPISPYGEDATRIVAGKISDADFDFLFKRVYPFRGANDRVIAILMQLFVEFLKANGITAWSIENEMQFYTLVNNPKQLHIEWTSRNQ